MLCTFTCFSPIQADEFIDENLNELINIRENLFSVCPPSVCIYVCVGKSPGAASVALRASLQAKDAERLVVDIPVSGMENYYKLDPDTKEVVHSRFDQVFSKYLPRDKIKGKRVLLIDVALSGASLAGVYDELSRFVEANNIQSQVEGAALNNDNQAPDAFKNRAIKIIPTTITGALLFKPGSLRFRKFDKVDITSTDESNPYSLPSPRPDVEQRFSEEVMSLRKNLSEKGLTLAAVVPNSLPSNQKPSDAKTLPTKSARLSSCIRAILGF